MKYRISGLVLLETFSEMSLRIGAQFMGEECIDLANLKILPFLVQDKSIKNNKKKAPTERPTFLISKI